MTQALASGGRSPDGETMTGMGKHKKRMTGDQMRHSAMWVLASGVAAIAAAVSYSHIYDLGRVHGGTGVPARLLPLSVDALILVGELMLLHEADAKGRRFVLGWVLVWSGILATLAANVAYGAQFGWLGALIWGWPAYSFILAAAGMVSVVKRAAVATKVLEVVATEAPEVVTDVTTEITPEIMLEVTAEVTDVSTCQDDSRSEPVITHDITPPVTTEVTLPVTTEVTTPVTTDITPQSPLKRRRVVPAKATDDELVVIVLDVTDDPAALTNYKVNKAIKEACGGKGVGETRAARLVDLAQRQHRSATVVPMERRA